MIIAFCLLTNNQPRWKHVAPDMVHLGRTLLGGPPLRPFNSFKYNPDQFTPLRPFATTAHAEVQNRRDSGPDVGREPHIADGGGTQLEWCMVHGHLGQCTM